MCAEHSERQRVPSIGSFNVNYDLGFMLHVVACVLEWLSERTHPVESRGQEFHWMSVCPRTAALRLCSVPHLPSTQTGRDLGAEYRAAPLDYWSPTDTDTIIKELRHDCVMYHRTTNPK